MKKIQRKTFIYFRDFVRTLLIVLIFSTVFNFWYINEQRDYYQQYITHSTELRVLTQEIPKYAGEAVLGQRDNTFRNLRATYEKTNTEITILKEGEVIAQKVTLPPSPDKIKTVELNRYASAWDDVKQNVDIILKNQDVIENLDDTASRLIDNMTKVLKLYWDAVDILGNSAINQSASIVLVSRQINLAERIVDDVQKIMTITNETPELLKQFSGRSDTFFSDAVSLHKKIMGLNLDEKLLEIDEKLKLLRDDVNLVNKIGAVTEKVHAAILAIFNMSPVLSSLAKNLENAYITYQQSNTTADFTAYVLGLASFLVLLLSINLLHKESELHLRTTEEKNNAMQTEVEKLLKELPEIAGGDSSVETVVNSEVTSSSSMITESFAYALNTLRHLVHNIGKTAKNVSIAASDAQQITKELAASSSNQAQEIVEVTASVSAMAASIEQVSANASESAAVALESVNIAGEGGKVVRSTISGMERIQSQIQETSNYMRRLSDSSQEIGEIVSLIDGIADQTNILSLNASIQAAMAGEAGRGFAVVADEVQRLAEKVSYATKEIGSLVRSIQTDTSQVIVAMDQTKAQVLEGVNSAQEAGSTLEKIETVSRRLSDLIQNISSSASEQASVSGKISHIMNDVKDIAKQTASGTITTVDLIGKLMQYVTDLRNSVFELKLPDNSNKTGQSKQ